MQFVKWSNDDLMVVIYVIKASIVVCEADVKRCTRCDREGRLIDLLLLKGGERRFKGIYSYVNHARGRYCIVGTLRCVGFKCLVKGTDSYVNKVRAVLVSLRSNVF